MHEPNDRDPSALADAISEPLPDEERYEAFPDEDLDDVLDGEPYDAVEVDEAVEVERLDAVDAVALAVPPEDLSDEDEDDDDYGDDLLDAEVADEDGPVLASAVSHVGQGRPDPMQARIEALEAASRSLARAEVVREGRHVRRKVSAATTAAGAVGFVPILLQLVGAIDLSPELAASASTVGAIVGAFAGGWLTPERKPALPATSAHSVLRLGPDGQGRL